MKKKAVIPISIVVLMLTFSQPKVFADSMAETNATIILKNEWGDHPDLGQMGSVIGPQGQGTVRVTLPKTSSRYLPKTGEKVWKSLTISGFCFLVVFIALAEKKSNRKYK